MFQQGQHSIIPYKNRNKIFWTGIILWFVLIVLFITLTATEEPLWLFAIIINGIILAANFLQKMLELDENWKSFAKSFGFKVSERVDGLTLSGLYKNHWIKITDRRLHSSEAYASSHRLQISITLKHMINTELFISQNHYERFFPSKSKQEFSWYISYIANPEEFFSKTISSSHYLQGLKELSESAPGMSITIEGQTLSYEESGRVPDTDYITAVLEFLTKIVLQVERLDQYRLSY